MLTPDEGAAMAAAKNPLPHSPSPSQSPSPVPYLFGGLAAMMGLIACAVLILICSYWRLAGPLGTGDDPERDPETGDGNGNDGSAAAPPAVMEEKLLVILAGQEKPTCLATPVASRVSSFGSNCSCSSSTVSSESSTLGKSEGENDEKKSRF
ncbi:PREDICTED: protein GLUTAMINE DUMPER 5-like [Ipomoea nil]|uniref:protein GLUTAMINE DUMPER 5-like n=1 Tax=Ipomoea nil TaxID=35883 RepID=UPI000900E5EE|nr:PREDICTED: protein GLUTAMINE DUMPER 5-like [Ipomoea nil]